MSSVITSSFSNTNATQVTLGNAAVDLRSAKVTDIIAKQQTEVTKVEEQPADQVTPKQLGDAVERINQFVNAEMRTLNFSVDENSGKAVVKVIDFETKDVIRQIPGDEVLRMASAIKRLQEDLGSATGLLIDSKV
ncbi:MAG: flagellar protein FlaG [Gammaproteobacteria bacterium]|nr:flagellar protein FlaG [Gammaproteobacteria bacterium]